MSEHLHGQGWGIKSAGLFPPYMQPLLPLPPASSGSSGGSSGHPEILLLSRASSHWQRATDGSLEPLLISRDVAQEQNIPWCTTESTVTYMWCIMCGF